MRKNESEISKWLSGTHNFTLRTIASISEAFGEDILFDEKYVDNYSVVDVRVQFVTFRNFRNNKLSKTTNAVCQSRITPMSPWSGMLTKGALS